MGRLSDFGQSKLRLTLGGDKIPAMAEQDTSNRWSLRATHPERLHAVAEIYATTSAAAARAADLRQAGYTVEMMPSDLPRTD